MKTYPVRKNNGALLSFEIDNSFIMLRTIKHILFKIKGISNIKVKKIFHNSDVLVEFDYLGFKYEVLEPYGDSNHLLIGPKEPSSEALDISNIENAFKAHKRYLLFSIILVFSILTAMYLFFGKWWY